jgi:hypothetical protein
VTADLVLAGRGEQVREVRGRLSGSAQITTIAGPSLDETRAFIAAAVVKADQEGDGQWLARTAFVDDLATWRSLIERDSALVLVPMEEGLAGEVPTGCRHHILVPVTNSDTADIALSPIDAAAAKAALVDAGVADERQAEELGRLGRHSLTALRRRLATKPALHVPVWATAPSPRARRAALLACSWSDGGEGDRRILSELAGEDYEDLRQHVTELANQDDPMLVRVGGSWHVVSPFDAWLLLRSHVTEDDLQRLEHVIDDVMAEEDPALDLAPEDRWRAGLENKVRLFSADLRRGLAKTLALLGVHGSSIPASAGSTGATWAGYLVRKALERANQDPSARIWASISDLLPLLGEAAPDVFLDAVRDGLEGDNPLLGKLFIDSEAQGAFAPASPHTGLLWALETVAWSPDHFGAAVDLLARLDAVDPGGRLSNRPFGSLVAIFCPWHPENAVTPERRLKVIDALRRRHGEMSWRLLLSMLPEMYGAQSPTAEPRYQPWKPGKQPVTYAEYFSFVDEIVARAIEDAAKEPGRWEDLLERMPHLPPPNRAQVIGALGVAVAAGSFPEREPGSMWRKVQELVAQHREFSTAPWALPEAQLEPIAALASRLAPESGMERYSRLFMHRTRLGEEGLHPGDPTYDAVLAERRLEAVQAIVEEGGLDLICQLARTCDVPWSVGESLAEAVGERFEEDLLGLLVSDERAEIEVAGNYFRRRFGDEGWTWLRATLDGHPDITALQRARLLLAARDFPVAWEEADTRGAETAIEYWKGFVPIGLGHDFPAVEVVADRLLRVGRNAAALGLISMYRQHGSADSAAVSLLIVRGLDGFLAAPGDDAEVRALSEWEFEQLFSMLEEHREDVGPDIVAGLEWAYLPVLGLSPEVPTLQQRMAQDPAFYVDIVSTVYRARSAAPDDEDSGEDGSRVARAANGYHLLRAWSVPPGTEHGIVDGTRLHEWLDEVVRRLREADRYDVGLSHLGQVLVFAATDEESTWPPLVVRDLLEELQSPSLEDGFRGAILNRRGVTSRGLEEGGAQEQGLVAKYRTDADAFADEWPRTAAILRSVAQSYEAEGRRNEDSAERFRRGL